MLPLETLLRLTIYERLTNLWLQKELIISESRLSLLFLISNSTELKQFCYKLMKLKKLWLCIKNFIDGMSQSRLLKRKTIQMSESSKKIISNGLLILIKRLKLLKSRKEKVISIPQLHSIWKEVFQQKPPILLLITTLEYLKINLKKFQLNWLVLICLRKLVISLRGWIFLTVPWIVMSEAMPSEKQLI